MRILHFADAHVDMSNYGRRDPESGLPLRVLDFLKSLDTIIETAINEQVDLVIFAGDAYKDRTPAPTFQREWGKRIVQLSQAGIPTLLLVGNHDLSPAPGRAHAIHEFDTLKVPLVHVLDKPQLLSPQELGLPIQVMALPWVSRSGMMAALEMSGAESEAVYERLENLFAELIQGWFERIDETLPVVMVAHATVQGAKVGLERTIMLGADLSLSGSLVKDPRLDYVALGHIHKPQNLTADTKSSPDQPPPVVYPGSIERVDFGEAQEGKFFVIATVERGKSSVEWRQLTGIRPFIDCKIELTSDQSPTQTILSKLPAQEKMKDAIVRLIIEYPQIWDDMIDESALRKYAEQAFEFHLLKRPQRDIRIRLPEEQSVSSLSPLELLEIFWLSSHIAPEEMAEIQHLAQEILTEEIQED